MKWYAVKKEYIDYLKKWDKKIPNVDYGNRMKCFIGVIFIKNDIEYFAPLTSFKEKFISMKNDVDFCIVSPKMKGIKFFSLKGDLEETLCKNVDIFQLHCIEVNSPIYKNIFKEGLTIYSKEN